MSRSLASAACIPLIYDVAVAPLLVVAVGSIEEGLKRCVMHHTSITLSMPQSNKE